MKMNKIRISRSKKNGQFYFAVLSGNNKIIAQSETYKRIGGVRNAVRRLIVGFGMTHSKASELILQAVKS